MYINKYVSFKLKKLNIYSIVWICAYCIRTRIILDISNTNFNSYIHLSNHLTIGCGSFLPYSDLSGFEYRIIRIKTYQLPLAIPTWESWGQAHWLVIAVVLCSHLTQWADFFKKTNVILIESCRNKICL